MHDSRLESSQIQRIHDFLAKWRYERGTEILGSQLGLAVTQITGRPVREIGGLRSIVQRELSALVTVAGLQTHAPDITLLVLVRPMEASSPQAIDEKTSGAALWRYFSNPKLNCFIAAHPSGRIYIAPSAAGDSQLRPDFVELIKPTSEDFRVLAKDFLSRQSPVAIAAAQELLDQPDFYNDWVQYLRRVSSTEANLLHAWEATRADFVAARLAKELQKAGIDIAEATRILVEAKSRKPPSFTKTANSVAPVFREPPQRKDTNTHPSYRQAIHAAIDMMSVEELRRLPIPSGLMFDATAQALI